MSSGQPEDPVGALQHLPQCLGAVRCGLLVANPFPSIPLWRLTAVVTWVGATTWPAPRLLPYPASEPGAHPHARGRGLHPLSRRWPWQQQPCRGTAASRWTTGQVCTESLDAGCSARPDMAFSCCSA